MRGGLALTSVAFHVDQLWFAAPGGIGTYVRELLEALPRVDPTTDLVAFHSRWRAPARGSVAYGSSSVEVPGSIRTLYPRWDLFARPSLPQRLSRCDIVHGTNPAAVPPAAPGQRLVVTVHDLAFERFPELFPRSWRWLYRAGLRAAVQRAAAILVPSRATADDLLARTRVDPDRVHVVPLAASLPSTPTDPAPVLERLGIPSPYVLSVGTLEPRKNLARLVRAYRGAAASGLPHALVLAGPVGWHPEELLAELAKAGPGRIVRTGALAGKDLDALYRGAALFAYPSLYEGFGLPVVEAMARGVPTIASDSSAIPEAAGTAALLVDPRSEGELTTAIERVLADEDLAARMREDGRAQASRFSWDGTAEGTLAVYRKVTS
ncbi:MAG: glycosyltransferase family 4 protein [Actinobacteria bacterium]|nr:glycosyltransferase family 4 protein [Actinomycetota bacterium]